MFSLLYSFFFFNATATTEIYTLSLHDALPIWELALQLGPAGPDLLDPLGELAQVGPDGARLRHRVGDRKSTRLNSSHVAISYAVFCLKKKKKKITTTQRSTSRQTSPANILADI